MIENASEKTAIVFAASRGIGRAVALKLGKMGVSVAINFVSNEAKALDLLSEIEASGGKAIMIKGDAGSSSDVDGVFKATRDAFGGIDFVVNAAGASEFAPLSMLEGAAMEKLVRVNVWGAFNVLSAAAREVADGGAIVQFSTGGTKMPVPGGGAYAGTKAAGELMALSLAKELGERQIRVNAISPGVTNTDGLIMPEDQVQMLISQTPLGRLGEPRDVADAVLFLLSDQGAWVTGQNLQANGGIL